MLCADFLAQRVVLLSNIALYLYLLALISKLNIHILSSVHTYYHSVWDVVMRTCVQTTQRIHTLRWPPIR